MPDIIDVIFSRRSIRRFTSEPVENESLILLLKAAMAAPMACNSQPREFIVTEPERFDQIRDRFLFARYNAPAAIVVCGNIGIANNSAARDHWVQVLETLMLDSSCSVHGCG